MNLPQRRSIRLQKFDYSSPGVYYITIVTHSRISLFGHIIHHEMNLNKFGEILNEELERTPIIRPEISLDIFQIMPNHLHLVIVNRPVGVHSSAPSGGRPSTPTITISPRKPRSLGSFVAGFKSITTKRINQLRETPGMAVWQRNYYEHIVRDDEDWERIRDYINANSTNWEEDFDNLKNQI